MTYLLDTNACIAFLRKRDSAIGRRLVAARYTDVVLCSIVKAELYFGARKSSRPEQTQMLLSEFFANFHSLPFDDAAAEEYGRLRAALESVGTPIGPNDLMIAAIARANHAILVSHNTREFSRIAGLPIEDWETP